MPINRKFWSRPWLLLALPLGLYALFSVTTGGAYVLAVMGGNYLNDQTLHCNSPADARAAGVFLDTVLVEPRVVRYGPYEVTFENCWFGQLRTSHRPAWYARRTVTKQPRAVFYLNYRTTYKNQPVATLNNGPLLSCEQTFGSAFIGQKAQQLFEVYTDMLLDSTISTPLPLDFYLTNGPVNSPRHCFVAYPASAKRLVHSAK